MLAVVLLVCMHHATSANKCQQLPTLLGPTMLWLVASVCMGLTGTSMRTLQNDRPNYRIQSLHVGMQLPGSSVTRTKEMLAYVGQKVWLVSNWTQHMPTSCNIAQHGEQTNATCCAHHVGTTCCARLHRPLESPFIVWHNGCSNDLQSNGAIENNRNNNHYIINYAWQDPWTAKSRHGRSAPTKG